MNSHNSKQSIEASISLLKDEMTRSGISLNNFVNEMNMVEILRRNENNQQELRSLIVSIAKTVQKNSQQNFQVENFLDKCLEFHQNSNARIENAQIQLSSLQQDRKSALDALAQIQIQEPNSWAKEKQKGTAVIEVKQIKGFPLLESNSTHVKLVYNGVEFLTKSQTSLESTMRNKKFMFELNSNSEKLQVLLIDSPSNPNDIIAGAQIDILNIKSSRIEWFNLYGPGNLSPLCQIKLFLDWIPSKTEYLNQVLEKIDGQIAIQVEAIEESEKHLKTFNSLFLSKKSLQTDNCIKFNENILFETVPPVLSQFMPYSTTETPKKKDVSVIKEDELEHLDNSTMNLYSKINFRNMPASEKISRTDIRNEVRQFPDIQMSLRKPIQPNQIFFDENSKSQKIEDFSRRNLSKELESKTHVSRDQSILGEDLLSLTQELQNLDFTIESQLNIPLNNKLNGVGKNSTKTRDLADKDAIISYLEKKLNDTSRENEKLQANVKKLTNENSKLIKENNSIQELKNQIQVFQKEVEFYKKKSVQNLHIEKLGNIHYPEDGLKPKPLNNLELNMNMKAVFDENAKLNNELKKKAQEITFWKNKAQETACSINTILDLSGSREKNNFDQTLGVKYDSLQSISARSPSNDAIFNLNSHPFLETKKRSVKIFGEKENLQKH